MVRDSLTGRTALVTGASSGIGRATAETLARDGASVVLAARRRDRLDSVRETIAAEHGVETMVQETDVTDEHQVAELVENTVGEFGSLDIVVNNAGVSYLEPVAEMDSESFDAMLQVNVYGLFFVARAAIPHLRDAEGNLVFIGSFSGQHPNAAHPVYSATKWWARGFALGLAGQIGGENVAVTVVNPSEVRTELGGSGDRRPTKDRYEPGEITEPSDVAETVVFAAKQEPPNTINELDIYRRDKLSQGTTPDTME